MGGATKMPELERGRRPGAPCARVVSVASTTASTRGTRGSGESTNVRAARQSKGCYWSGGGAVALEADGSMASPDWDTSSQVAECWALAVVVSDDAVDRDDDELNINPPTPFQ